MTLKELEQKHKILQALAKSLQSETNLTIRRHLHHKAQKLFSEISGQPLNNEIKRKLY